MPEWYGKDLEKLEGATSIERAVGPRYRTEVSDLGLGLTQRDMLQRLRDWGYDASQMECRTWIQRYRLGDGSKDGNVALYALSRQDLQRWYHVDGMTRHQLVDKYRAETGIFAHGEISSHG